MVHLSLNSLMQNAYDLTAYGYKILFPAGHGHQGQTFVVRCLTTSETLIAKIIDLSDVDDKEKVLALQEASVMSTMRCPRIVECRQHFILYNAYLVLILEYCEKGDLKKYIQDQKSAGKNRLSDAKIVQLMSEMAEALHCMHKHKVIHRDIKPSNILITKDDSFKLGDFGISRLNSSPLGIRTVIGTPQYMPPEVCLMKSHTYKSDIWALGCVIYEASSFAPLFAADSLLDLIYQITNESLNFEGDAFIFKNPVRN